MSPGYLQLELLQEDTGMSFSNLTFTEDSMSLAVEKFQILAAKNHNFVDRRLRIGSRHIAGSPEHSCFTFKMHHDKRRPWRHAVYESCRVVMDLENEGEPRHASEPSSLAALLIHTRKETRSKAKQRKALRRNGCCLFIPVDVMLCDALTSPLV
ncbi:hypothetical protein AUEXF2481DRAFT_573884 [Aureobasidium subglaciale EXF-2481]|uniref:Uncharacterized protein n=1 Tax=Aureobasidium subglaciale (strain EXF-2481) TaxID=1043005 RepID=A0A074Y2X3_AURSE|nr:uncharacterized protein AUEXF2481DRAFT_573884 [Aureobasidium subglaciale EXF-2481]KEQ90289.1 hypothetical protein AUEXF2481DRAFT_573884 [Aureobasidium subglaciale EXF-2481]